MHCNSSICNSSDNHITIICSLKSQLLHELLVSSPLLLPCLTMFLLCRKIHSLSFWCSFQSVASVLHFQIIPLASWGNGQINKNFTMFLLLPCTKTGSHIGCTDTHIVTVWVNVSWKQKQYVSPQNTATHIWGFHNARHLFLTNQPYKTRLYGYCFIIHEQNSGHT